MKIKQAKQSNRHAVVIGASMAGLLAARVLSEHFEQVTIIERDRLSEQVEPRKGVPQGQHAHVLLMKGETILRDLFPDLYERFVQDGAVPLTWLLMPADAVREHLSGSCLLGMGEWKKPVSK